MTTNDDQERMIAMHLSFINEL